MQLHAKLDGNHTVICGRTNIDGLEQLEAQQNYIIRNTIHLDKRAGPRADQRKKRSQVAAHEDYIRQEWVSAWCTSFWAPSRREREEKYYTLYGGGEVLSLQYM